METPRKNRSQRDILAQIDAANLSAFDLALFAFFVDAAAIAPHALFAVTDITHLMRWTAPDVLDGIAVLTSLDLLDVSTVTRQRSGHSRTAYAFELFQLEDAAYIARRLRDRLADLYGRPAADEAGR